MLPKIGVRLELASGLWVTVKQQNPSGYSPDKPQEFIGEDDEGNLHTLQSKDIHPRYFR
jgi:hypothetical protein